MPETLHRITYDATIDDAVDVAFRLAARTQAFRRQIRQNVIIAGILGGLGFIAAWMSFITGPGGFDLAMAVAGGVVFGVVFAILFKHFFTWEMHKQHRKMVAEQFGGKPTIPSELELRSDAVWVRQAGMEMILDGRTSELSRHRTAAGESSGGTMTRLRVAAMLIAGAVFGASLSSAPQAPARAPAWATKELRAGIIGTDTSHVPQFVKIFHAHPEWKVTVVAAFKGGSPDLPLSANRLEGFAKTIQTDGVELVDSIEALLPKVDVVLLTSVDGRPHLAQVTPVFKAGKRVFIDKPLAASLADARAIAALSRDTRTPFFSASSVRFHKDIPTIRANTALGKVRKVEATYLVQPLEFHPDLFYYGIHGVEALYATMGPGCTSLTRKMDGVLDVTTCTWKDGRVGTFRGLPKADATQPLIRMAGDKGSAETTGAADNEGIVRAIAEFFHTGRPPVDVAQTIEVFEFMTAAQVSKERGGAEVKLAELRK